MAIGVLLIILSVINVLFIFSFIIILFMPFYYYSIPVAMVSIILYLLISTIFFKYTNKYLEKEKENLKSFKLSKRIYKMNEIEFIKVDNKWVFRQDKRVEFVLDNYLFKKSFIIARIIREVRYPMISNKVKLNNLLKLKLKVNNVNNLVIRFVDEKKTKEYFLVKNYISQNTILSKSISKAKYYRYFFSAYSLQFLKIKKEINEDIYLK